MKKRKSTLPVKSYKFRAYPTKEQQDMLWKHARALNVLYNKFLDERKSKDLSERKDRVAQSKSIKELRPADPVLSEILCLVIHQSIHDRLDAAFSAYRDYVRKLRWMVKAKDITEKQRAALLKKLTRLEKRGGPEYRSIVRDGFYTMQFCCTASSGRNCIVEKNYVKISTYGKIKIERHREVIGEVKSAQLTFDHGCWYVVLSSEYEPGESVPKQGELGIDIGVINIVATSDGRLFKTPKDRKYYGELINALKSRRDHHEKGSHKWKQINGWIRRYEGKHIRVHNDYLHKLTRGLADENVVIYCEDLNIKSMTESNKTRKEKADGNSKKEEKLLSTKQQSALNRSILSVCPGRLISFLSNKTTVVKVNKDYTSKMCYACGTVSNNQTLADRTLVCERCGATIDRDVNAAKNILCLGKAYQANPDRTGLSILEILRNERIESPMELSKMLSQPVDAVDVLSGL